MKKILSRFAYLLCILAAINFSAFFYLYNSASKLLIALKEESKHSNFELSFDSIRPYGFLLWNMGVEIKNLHLTNKSSSNNSFAPKEIKADKARFILAAWRKGVDVILKNTNYDITFYDEFFEIAKLRYTKFEQQSEFLIQTSYANFTDIFYIYKDIIKAKKLEFKNTENKVNFKFDNLYFTIFNQKNFFVDSNGQELFAEYNLANNKKPCFINILRNKDNDTIKIKTDSGDFEIKLNDKFAAKNEIEEVMIKFMSQMQMYPHLKLNADIDFSFDPPISQLYEEIKRDTVNFDKISMRTKIHNFNFSHKDVGINMHGDLKFAKNEAFTDMKIDFNDIDSLMNNLVQFMTDSANLVNNKDKTGELYLKCIISTLTHFIKKHAPYDAEANTHQVRISLPSLPITNLKIMGQDTKTADKEMAQLLSSCYNGVIAEVDKTTEASK